MASWLARLARKQAAPDAAGEDAGREPGGDTPRTTIEVLTADAALAIEIDASGERIIDILNNHDVLGGPADEGGQPTRVRVERILIAFPPPQPTNLQRRLHRPRQPLRIRVGPYRVAGHVHVPPGAQATGYLMRVRPRFVAVTDAVICVEEPEWVERYSDVVLVNLQLADGIEEISDEDADPQAQPAAAPPEAVSTTTESPASWGPPGLGGELPQRASRRDV